MPEPVLPTRRGLSRRSVLKASATTAGLVAATPALTVATP